MTLLRDIDNFTGMVKKILLTTLVIVSGIMLGVILSSKSGQQENPNKSSSSKPPSLPPITAEPSAEVGINATLKIDKASIKAYDKSIDITKNLAKIDKALVNIVYENKSDEDLTDVKLWLDISNQDQLGYSDTETAKANVAEISRRGQRIYDISNIKSGETVGAHVWIFGQKPGRYTITAQVKSDKDNIVSNKPNSITLTVQ